MGDLTKNFSRREFACHCCGALPVNWAADGVPPLVTALQELRDQVGAPVTVVSGYRCPKHNREVGGAKNSQHVLGMAADIVIPGKSVKEMYAAACGVEAFEEGGIGLYPKQGFIHVDVRDYMARWAQVGGKTVDIDEVLG
jgi:uncharacterized protein YcbK (DUF882 family)